VRRFQESDTTSREDTFLDGGTGSIEGVVIAVLLLTDFDLGSSTDFDDSDTAAKLGKALLQLALVELRGSGAGDDGANLLAASPDKVLGAISVENNGVVLGDGDGVSAAERVGNGVFELEIKLVGEDRSTSEDGEIAEDGPAVVTKAGSLDGDDLELAAELVKDICKQQGPSPSTSSAMVSVTSGRRA